MDQQTKTIILIVAIVFGLCFLSYIPISIINKKKRNKGMRWVGESLQLGYSVVHFSGNKLLVNGNPIPKDDLSADGSFNQYIRLFPGQYTFSCRFAMTSPSLRGNKNYYTEKADYNVILETGKEYMFELAGDSSYYNVEEFQVFVPLTAYGATATVLFGEGRMSDRS